MDYPVVKALLEGLQARYGWEPIMEGEYIIGVQAAGLGSVTLEPGGQFELSGAPVANLHQTAAEVAAHVHQLEALSEEQGVRFLGLVSHLLLLGVPPPSCRRFIARAGPMQYVGQFLQFE